MILFYCSTITAHKWVYINRSVYIPEGQVAPADQVVLADQVAPADQCLPSPLCFLGLHLNHLALAAHHDHLFPRDPEQCICWV